MQQAAIATLDLITRSTFAHIIDRAESTVRFWESRGVIRAVARTPTGVRLYHRADAERLKERPRGAALDAEEVGAA